MDRYERREEVKDRIEYETLCCRHNREDVDELVELITETLCGTRPTIRIGGEDMPAEQVKSRFLTLDCEHVSYVFESMARNSTDTSLKGRSISIFLNQMSVYLVVTVDFKWNGFKCIQADKRYIFLPPTR